MSKMAICGYISTEEDMVRFTYANDSISNRKESSDYGMI